MSQYAFSRLTRLVIMLMLTTLTATSSFCYVTFEAWQHPRVMGKFWELPVAPPYAFPPPPGGDGPQGDGEVPRLWPWDHEALTFVRGLDVMLIANAHVISYYYLPFQLDSTIIGWSLNHEFFGIDEIDHDLHHNGSKQEFLGKSNWGLMTRDAGQVAFSTRSIEKIESADLLGDHPHEPARELADWVSPAWFCLATGDYIDCDIDADEGLEGEEIIIPLKEGNIASFQHACWGEDSPACSGDPGSEKDVRSYTLAMIVPDGYRTLEINAAENRPYEIFKITGFTQDDELIVERNQYKCPRLNHYDGDLIRPMVFTNPNNFGSVAFAMNPTTACPPAMIGGIEYRWLDLQAIFVKNHDLLAQVHVYYEDASVGPYFYVAEGVRNDTYQRDGLKGKIGKFCQTFLHSETVDFDLDGNPDCDLGGQACETGIDPGSVSCEEPIREAWRAGYITYFRLVRDYTELIRDDEDNLYAIPNGFPDTVRMEVNGELSRVAEYVNGMYFEDANAIPGKDTTWLGEWNPDEQRVEKGVMTRAIFCDTSSFLRDPRYVVFTERDREINWKKWTNLPQMRLTLAASLLIDDGFYGTTGFGSSRSTLIDTLDGNLLIEDYYDEYAVDFEGRGYRHPLFQDIFWDEEDPLYRDEDLLLEAKFYLGEPIDEVRVYAGHNDMLFREFDHGVVIAHFGQFAHDPGDTEYDFDVTAVTWVEPPWSRMCGGDPCHFMRILGSPEWIPYGPYNDGTNDGEHPVGQFWVDNPSDDEVAGPGDAIILLKENDGFEVHEDHERGGP